MDRSAGQFRAQHVRRMDDERDTQLVSLNCEQSRLHHRIATQAGVLERHNALLVGRRESSRLIAPFPRSEHRLYAVFARFVHTQFHPKSLHGTAEISQPSELHDLEKGPAILAVLGLFFKAEE